MNWGNVLKTVVAVAAAANKIIRHVAKTNPSVAKAVQSFDNFVNAFTGGGGQDNSAGGGDSGGKGADRSSGGLSAAERKRREEERKRREQEQKAQAFDDDIARTGREDDLEEDGDVAVKTAEQATDLRQDIVELTWGEFVPAALQVAAMGNPILQAMVQMWRFERQHLDELMGDADTVEKVEQKLVAIIGAAEEGAADTIEAARFYKMAANQDYNDKLSRLQDTAAKRRVDPRVRAKLLDSETMNMKYQPDGDSIPTPLDCSGLEETACDQLNAAFDRIAEPSPEIDALRSQLASGLEGGTLDLSELTALAGEMSDTFGYELILDDFVEDTYFGDDQQRATLLLNLLTANLNMVGYLDEVQRFGRENDLPVTDQTGLEIFRQVFGEDGNVAIHLGADYAETVRKDTAGNPVVIGAFEGLTPQRSDDMFLGSAVTAATITHEFGHQLDRYLDTQGSTFLLSSGSREGDGIMSFETFLSGVARNRLATDQGLAFEDFTPIMQAVASEVPDAAEIFANVFMTAVLNDRDFTVRSDVAAPEGDDLVAFTDIANARDVECAFRQYLLQTLSGTPITRDDYIICE